MKDTVKKEILITDIASSVTDSRRITYGIEKNLWRVLEYENSEYCGRLLCAGQFVDPEPVRISLNAQGRYRIYLGLMQQKGAPSAISLRLSDEEEIFHIGAVTEYDWTPLETMVESYWRTATLDGKELILGKPKDYLPHTSALAWIRLVPTETEDKKPQSMAYHLDSDYFADDDYPSPVSNSGRILSLSDGGARLILQEDFASPENKDYNPDQALFPRAAKYKQFYHRKSEIEKALISTSHKIGADIYAAYRVEAASFAPPNDFSGVNVLFSDSYSDLSDFRCMSRDGRRLHMCSFAYPEVRERILNNLRALLRAGYDGISLVFCRGIFVLFEEPVCSEVFRRYGIDARRLPISDPRYNSVASEFVTELLRELRKVIKDEFGGKKGINAVLLFTPEDSKSIGLDALTWVREGLVDSIAQGLMRTYEDLDGCLDDDGLIDLERYSNKLLREKTVKREFRATPKNVDLIVEGARAFSRICEGRVDFYATLLWEAQGESETIALCDRLKEIGITKFISWNANHKAKILSRINAEKYYVAGSEEEYREKTSRYLRTLSVGGADISQFDPNWKG